MTVTPAVGRIRPIRRASLGTKHAPGGDGDDARVGEPSIPYDLSREEEELFAAGEEGWDVLTELTRSLIQGQLVYCQRLLDLSLTVVPPVNGGILSNLIHFLWIVLRYAYHSLKRALISACS